MDTFYALVRFHLEDQEPLSSVECTFALTVLFAQFSLCQTLILVSYCITGIQTTTIIPT